MPHVRAHTVHARTVQHIGCDSLESARALAAHAEALSGVDAIAGMAPSFFRPTSAAALVDFLAPVAAAAPGTPFFYYHFPTITNCTVNASEFFKEAKETGRIPTLAGMKYTVRNHDEGTHRPSWFLTNSANAANLPTPPAPTLTPATSATNYPSILTCTITASAATWSPIWRFSQGMRP